MSVWSNQLNKPGPAVLLLTTLLRNKTWKKGRIKSLNIKLQETEAALRRFRQPPNAIKIMALKGVWDVTGLKGAKSTRCRSEVPLNVLKFADFRREKMTAAVLSSLTTEHMVPYSSRACASDVNHITERAGSVIRPRLFKYLVVLVLRSSLSFPLTSTV